MRRGRPARGSQRKRDYHEPKRCTQNREADTFKKRPCGPVLKDKLYRALGFWRSPRVGIGQSRSGRGLSLRKHKNEVGSGSCLSQSHVFSRGLNRKMLPLAGEFRPLRRATRRCPPWTRTGLMSGDRKATRYWALAFGPGAAPAGASDSPACQRPGNRLALCSFKLSSYFSDVSTGGFAGCCGAAGGTCAGGGAGYH